MKNITLLLISIVSVTAPSCGTRTNTLSDSGKNGVPVVSADSLKITVKSYNLSENISGNDEILVIAYIYKNDSAALDKYLFQQKLKIDLNNTWRQFRWKSEKDITGKDLIFFLIEQDSETAADQIDSVLRIHHREINKRYNNRSYSAIEEYLGDEDVLGIRVISKMDHAKMYTFYFKGVYKLDKYEYEVTIENNKPNTR